MTPVVALEDTNSATTDQLRVAVDGDGRVSWRSAQHGQLAVDGRTQLDLAAVLDGLATAYGRTVLGAEATVARPGTV